MRTCPATLALLLLLLCPAAQAETPRINWYGMDWAPSWIVSGPLRGEGYSDRVQDQVQNALVNYDHNDIWTSFPRALRALKQEENACFVPGFYEWQDTETGRPRTDIVWSAPIFLFYWHGITLLRENREKYAGDGAVSVDELMSRPDLRVGLQAGRTYGPTLDPIIASRRDQADIIWRNSDKQTVEGQYKLLLRGRVDYLVDYSFMMRFAERMLGASGRFAFIPVAEHAGKIGLGSIACNNSPFGRKVMAEINGHLRDIRKTDAFRSANSDWFMIAGQEEEYWRAWEKELLSREE